MSFLQFQPGGKQAFHGVPAFLRVVTCMAASPEVAEDVCTSRRESFSLSWLSVVIKLSYYHFIFRMLRLKSEMDKP